MKNNSFILLVLLVSSPAYAECYRANDLRTQSQSLLSLFFANVDARNNIEYVVRIEGLLATIEPLAMDCIVEKSKKDDTVRTVYCGKELSIEETGNPNSPENDQPLTQLRRISGQILETWILFTEIGTVTVIENSNSGDGKSYQGLLGVC